MSDLVLLQKELYIKTRSRHVVKVLALKYLIWKIFGNGVWDPRNLDQEALQNEMRCLVLLRLETVVERKNRSDRWFDFSALGRSLGDLKHFIKQANDYEIPYLYLSILVTSKAREGLSSAATNLMSPILESAFLIQD